MWYVQACAGTDARESSNMRACFQDCWRVAGCGGSACGDDQRPCKASSAALSLSLDHDGCKTQGSTQHKGVAKAAPGQ